MEWQIDGDSIIFSKEKCPTDMWEFVHEKLEELYLCNKAELGNSGKMIVSHEIIASLTQEEREILLLPKIFPYRIAIHSTGGVATKRFRYQIEYLNTSEQAFINPVTIGAYIRIDDDLEYTFSYGQYYITKKVHECNNNSTALSLQEIQFYNLKNLADIQSVANHIDASLDANTVRTKVIVPKKLSVVPKFDLNGDLIIEPLILGENGAVNKEFQKRFKARSNVNKIYTDTKGNCYLIGDEVFAGLKEIKENKKIKAEAVSDFMENPEAVLTASIFDFDTESYSDRILEIGEYKYSNSKSLTGVTSWLPEEGVTYNPLDDNDENTFKVTEENAKKIQILINEAQQNEKSSIVYNNEEIPITLALLRDVNTHINKDKLPHQTIKKDFSRSKRANPKILIIKDNFEKLSYDKVNTSSVKDTILNKEYIENCLRPGISLFKHQIEGLKWLLIDCYAHDYRGALLSDDMGLGKTIQTLCFLAICKKYFSDDIKGACLIVAPVSLLRNWKNEYERFIRDNIFDKVEILDKHTIKKYKTSGKADFSQISPNSLVLINYDTLRANQLALGKIDWGIMVLDEAQSIKNPFARVSLAAKAMKYNFGLALTGTPIENTWIDLWSIMDFVAPGYNLGTLSEFKGKYVHKLKACGRDEKKIFQLGQQLNEELTPIFLRRLKNELIASGQITGLPKKCIRKLAADMPKAQLTAYKSVLNEYAQGKHTKGAVLQALFRLRDISLLPNIASLDERAITIDSMQQIINSSARLEIVFEELSKINMANEKALIFLESKKMQRILRRMLMLHFNLNIEMPINGDMDGMKRQRIVDNFNQSAGFNVLILSPIAAGVGLNISSANHVIHLSRHWNPAKEDQATDRAYRIGQKKDVEVCIPIAKHPDFGIDGAFDQKLDQLLEYKRRLSEGALFPVGDSEQDGIDLFNTLGGLSDNVKQNETKDYVDLEWIDNSNGRMFERIIEKLYTTKNYRAEKTPDSNDGGVDVVVLDMNGNSNFLIQCKKTHTYTKAMGQAGIKEVYAAVPGYETKYGCKFQKIVITNAEKFTSGAVQLAKETNVELITRKDIKEMLKQNPVEKFFY